MGAGICRYLSPVDTVNGESDAHQVALCGFFMNKDILCAFNISAATGFRIVLAFGSLAYSAGASADAPSIPGTEPAQEAQVSTDDARIAELRENREQAEAELKALSQPVDLGKGAFPHMPSEERLERRALYQQIARGYDEQIDDLHRLKDARQRREEILKTSAGWSGFAEPPPYSIFLADQIWNTRYSLRLAVEGLESQLGLIQLRFDRARDALKAAEERLRQASERVETTKDDPAQGSLERSTRDLEDLRKRAAAVSVNAAETSKARVEEELADTRARLAFAQRQFEAADPQVTFTQADLNKVRARLSKEERRLETDLQQAISERQLQSQALQDSERHLQAQIARQSTKPTADQAATAMSQAKEAIERQRAQLDNVVLQGDLLKQLLDVVEGERQLWETRFALAHDPNPAHARQAFERFTPLFTNVRASRELLRQQLGVVSGQISEFDNRLRHAASAVERRHQNEMLQAYRQREETYNRSLQRIDQAARLLERWRSEIKERHKELPLSARVEDWRHRAWEIATWAWHFEVFSVEDTIEVEGKAITGSRGVTIGKILGALTILLVGYWICLYLARLIGRLAVTRLGLTADVANLVRQWSQAFLITILVIISLVSVKIPLTIFAFLGGAFAIGVGFGAQNLLKNVISGILILVERPLRVGDLIEVDNVRGRVTTIGLRSSTVRDAKGMETLIPNSSFLERNLTNWTYSSLFSRFSLRVGLAYGSPARQVSDLLGNLAKEHPKILKSPAPQVLLEEFGGQGFIFTVNYWLEIRLDMDPNEVASELRMLIEQKFTEAGLKVLPGG
jgi:potassium-dependent mechanosensitive channel